MVQNIFILFAPGLGGNHLANILSLDKNFTNRASIQSYQSAVDNAHTDIQNINYNSIKKNLPALVGKSNVLCGHWLEYEQLKEHNLLQHFPNRTFCTIQFPSHDSKLCSRFLNLSANQGIMPWVYNELGLLYKREYITKLIDEKDAPFMYVWPEMLINENIQVLINDLNNQGLNVEIDIVQAQQYHTMWLNKVFTSN